MNEPVQSAPFVRQREKYLFHLLRSHRGVLRCPSQAQGHRHRELHDIFPHCTRFQTKYSHAQLYQEAKHFEYNKRLIL